MKPNHSPTARIEEWNTLTAGPLTAALVESARAVDTAGPILVKSAPRQADAHAGALAVGVGLALIVEAHVCTLWGFATAAQLRAKKTAAAGTGFAV